MATVTPARRTASIIARNSWVSGSSSAPFRCRASSSQRAKPLLQAMSSVAGGRLGDLEVKAFQIPP